MNSSRFLSAQTIKTVARTPLFWVLLAIGVFHATAINGMVGLLYDDGVYALAAKALSEGRGYVIPGGDVIVKYPPLLSVILAPLWWYGPFVETLLLMKGTVVLFSLASLYLTYRLARRYFGLTRPRALLVVCWLGTNLYWVQYSTNIMSETLYILLSLGILLKALSLEQQHADTPPSWKQLAVLAVLTTLLVYTRTFGFTLAAAILIWLGQRWGLKIAAFFAGGIALLYGPWMWWIHQQPSTIYAVQDYWVVPYNQTYWTEATLFWNKFGGVQAVLIDGAFDMLHQISQTMLPFLAHIQLLTHADAWQITTELVTVGILGILLWRWKGVHFKLSLPALYLFFYLLAVLGWHAHDQYPRFLLCVSPLIVLYLLAAMQPWFERLSFLNKNRLTAIIMAFTVIISFNLIADFHWLDFSRIRLVTNLSDTDIQLWHEYRQAFKDIRRLTGETDLLWSRYSSMYPIYTDRRTIAHNLFLQPNQPPPHSKGAFIRQVVLPMLAHEGVAYLIVEPRFSGGRMVAPVEPSAQALLDYAPERFEHVYASPHKVIKLYKFK